MERISIGLLENTSIFVRGTSSPCNGNHFLVYICMYESAVALSYVGLARAVSPSNTNFRLTFLLTRLQEALYEDLAV